MSQSHLRSTFAWCEKNTLTHFRVGHDILPDDPLRHKRRGDAKETLKRLRTLKALPDIHVATPE